MQKTYHGGFPHLSFPKTGSEIKDRVRKMISERLAKIEERKERLNVLSKEMKLDTSMDVLMNIDQLAQGQYSNAAEITVGKAAALRSEVSALKETQSEVERLQSISRNLPDGETFKLAFDELDYFGF